MNHPGRLPRWIGCCALIAAAAISSACNEDAEPDEPGVLALSWRISPAGCDSSGVETIKLNLSNNMSRTWSCDAGRGVLEGIEPGAYAVELLGLDKSGKAIFESGEQAVGIDPGAVTNVDGIRLTARPGSLNVGWHFDNGKLCSANSVTDIFVHVYDTDAFAIDESMASCAEGNTTIRGLKSGDLVIEVNAVGADMNDLFRGVEEITINRGDSLSIDVELLACDGGCGS